MFVLSMPCCVKKKKWSEFQYVLSDLKRLSRIKFATLPKVTGILEIFSQMDESG